MDWPPRAAAIADALYAQNPGLTTGSDDQQRLFVRLVADQLAFELGPAWGNKSAGPGRPQGPSQIAYNAEEGLGGWRIIDNDGSVTGVPGHPMPNPPWQAFPGQIFLPATPTDHLKTQPPPPPAPTPPPFPDQLADIFIRIAMMEDHLKDLAANVTALLQQIEALQRGGWPVYGNGWLTLRAQVPQAK